MDRVIVTLLLIIVGVTTVLSLKNWIWDVKSEVTNDANSSIEQLINENH